MFLLWVGYILFIRIRRPEVFDDWLEFTNSIFQTEEEIDLVKVRALRTDLINSWWYYDCPLTVVLTVQFNLQGPLT